LSPDLERLLRDAQKTLPEPDPALTERVRNGIVGSIGRGARRVPRGLAIIALTAVATGSSHDNDGRWC
jgi:hypothetical protein